MDVVSKKQTTATAEQTSSLWRRLSDLLVQMDAMERAAPTGFRANLAEMVPRERAELWGRLERRANEVMMAAWVPPGHKVQSENPVPTAAPELQAPGVTSSDLTGRRCACGVTTGPKSHGRVE